MTVSNWLYGGRGETKMETSSFGGHSKVLTKNSSRKTQGSDSWGFDHTLGTKWFCWLPTFCRFFSENLSSDKSLLFCGLETDCNFIDKNRLQCKVQVLIRYRWVLIRYRLQYEVQGDHIEGRFPNNFHHHLLYAVASAPSGWRWSSYKAHIANATSDRF